MKNRFSAWPVRLMLASLLTFDTQLSSVFAQGNLTPPGAPAPTMKTLDEIQPRIVINSNNTPGDATSLFKITNSGSYYLVSNITGVSGKHGIVIAAPNVSLDLNGFSLLGVPGSFDGINATNTAPRTPGLVVHNGVVASWGGNGINAQDGAPGVAFSRLVLLTNGLNGVVATGGMISDCVAQGHTAGGGGVNGITGFGSRIVNCVSRANFNGIRGYGGCAIEGCVTTDNSTGILGDNSTILRCTIFNSTFQGMFLFGQNRVEGNLINGNSHGSGIVVAGSSPNNVFDGNTLLNNPTAGIILTNTGVTGSLVIRNTAHGAGANNYLMGTGNAFGPIVNVAGTNDISAVTNSAHPWANLSY